MGKRSRRMRSPKFQKKFATKLGNLRTAITNTAETIVEKVEEIIEEVVEKNPNALRTLEKTTETTEAPVAELKPEPKKAKAKAPKKPRATRTKKAAATKE